MTPQRELSFYYFTWLFKWTSSFLSTRTLALRYSPLRRQAIDAALFPSIPGPLQGDLRCPHGCSAPYVSIPYLLSWNYRKYIAQTAFQICICYIILPSSISRVPRAHILISSGMKDVFLFNPSNVLPAFPIFLNDFPRFRSLARSPGRDRRLECFQARRGW